MAMHRVRRIPSFMVSRSPRVLYVSVYYAGVRAVKYGSALLFSGSLVEAGDNTPSDTGCVMLVI